MENATLISEMEQFHFGGKVICTDGEEGILTRLGVDASTYRVVSIAVKLSRFFGKTVYLPFSTVAEANADGVKLNITRDELAASERQPSATMIDGRTTVHEKNSNARGTLMLVAAHPESGQIAYIVARHMRGGQDLLLPAAYIKQIESGSITVSVPDAIWQTLPPYRSDRELQNDVEQVIFDFTPIHIDLPGMHVRVRDGVLYLDGNISSSLRGDMVVNQASGVPGILEIKNNLYGDDTLAGELAMALGCDPRTRDLPIGVYPRLGEVRLSGAVRTAAQKAAAEQIVKSHEGVRSVINDLVVDPKADLLNVMAASAGGDAKDVVPGKMVRHTK